MCYRGSSASNIDATPSQNRASIGSMTSLSSLANTQLCSHKALKFDCLTILNLSYNRLTELKFAVYNASDIVSIYASSFEICFVFYFAKLMFHF